MDGAKMYIDWTYVVLILPAILLSLWASQRVDSTFRKYQQQYNYRGMTGAQAARYVLDRNGLSSIRIEHISGNLTDHFDPKDNVIRLSDGVYNSSSSAAVGVACHEAGHAIQHSVNYLPIRIRTAIIPITNFGSKLAMPLILIGLLLSSFSPVFSWFTDAGIICFGLCTIFQLVTLPTEFDASRRAVQCIESGNLLSGEELAGAKKVLSAAALTYVAALAVSLAQLLRFIILFGNRRDDN